MLLYLRENLTEYGQFQKAVCTDDYTLQVRALLALQAVEMKSDAQHGISVTCLQR